MENKKERDLLKLKNYKISLKNKEKKLIDLYTEDLISKDEYINRKNEIKNSIINTEAELILLENEKEEKKQNIDFAKMFVVALSNLKNTDSKQEANKILKMVIKKIEINDDKEVFILLTFKKTNK